MLYSIYSKLYRKASPTCLKNVLRILRDWISMFQDNSHNSEPFYMLVWPQIKRWACSSGIFQNGECSLLRKNGTYMLGNVCIFPTEIPHGCLEVILDRWKSTDIWQKAWGEIHKTFVRIKMFESTTWAPAKRGHTVATTLCRMTGAQDKIWHSGNKITPILLPRHTKCPRFDGFVLPPLTHCSPCQFI